MTRWIKPTFRKNHLIGTQCSLLLKNTYTHILSFPPSLFISTTTFPFPLLFYTIRIVQMWASAGSSLAPCIMARPRAWLAATRRRSHGRASRHASRAITTVCPAATTTPGLSTAMPSATCMSITTSSATPTTMLITITTSTTTSAAYQYVPCRRDTAGSQCE